jgi:hypothetical protein
VGACADKTHAMQGRQASRGEARRAHPTSTQPALPVHIIFHFHAYVRDGSEVRTPRLA